ncbi:MAG: coenzyme F420-0:L-glutamate ligase [Candidatus Helarchaeota archaeon]
MDKIIGFGLKTPIIRPGDDIVKIIIDAVESNNIKVQEGDVFLIAETPLSVSQNRIIASNDIKPSSRAISLANKYEMDPRLVELVINEADRIYGGVKGVILTEKDNILHANAGIDQSNAPPGSFVLLPEKPQETAEMIKERLIEYFHTKIAVIIADSRTQPLKKGVIGGAIAVAGMEPIEDCRNKPDIYGYRLKYTYRAIADDLTSCAQLLFGETDQQIPIVLIRGVKITLTDKIKESMYIPPNQCLFMNILLKKEEL